MSLLPYEDQSAAYKKQLKIQKQQQAAADISEDSDEDEGVVKAEAGKDSASQVSEASASSAGASAAEETTASGTQTTQDTTAPPSDSLKKD